MIPVWYISPNPSRTAPHNSCSAVVDIFSSPVQALFHVRAYQDQPPSVPEHFPHDDLILAYYTYLLVLATPALTYVYCSRAGGDRQVPHSSQISKRQPPILRHPHNLILRPYLTADASPFSLAIATYSHTRPARSGLTSPGHALPIRTIHYC